MGYVANTMYTECSFIPLNDMGIISSKSVMSLPVESSDLHDIRIYQSGRGSLLHISAEGQVDIGTGHSIAKGFINRTRGFEP